ncbi:MAG: metal ABC transporter permease, partial [Bellilinea sp.]
WHFMFLSLVVVNLVAGFQALGTLMALGLMILPAAAARFWAGAVWSLAALSSALAFLSGFAGALAAGFTAHQQPNGHAQFRRSSAPFDGNHPRRSTVASQRNSF